MSRVEYPLMYGPVLVPLSCSFNVFHYSCASAACLNCQNFILYSLLHSWAPRWTCKTGFGKSRSYLVCIPDVMPWPSGKAVITEHLGLFKASASPKRQNHHSSALTMSICEYPRDILNKYCPSKFTV